jgi:hypothetical protein
MMYHYRAVGTYSGGMSYGSDMTFTTSSCDTTPNSFTFTDQTNVALNTTMTSDAITVNGITCAASLSVTGGTYSINGGAYTSASGTVDSGDTVTVRVQSSDTYDSTTCATLTIGGVSDAFSVTTAFADGTVPSFIGIFRSGSWYLDTNGAAGWQGDDTSIRFGMSGDTPIVGDWNCDGRHNIRVFRNGWFYLDSNDTVGWQSDDNSIRFGLTGDIPLVGNWWVAMISKLRNAYQKSENPEL